MIRRSSTLAVVCLFAFSATARAAELAKPVSTAEPEAAATTVDFARQIKPLLQERCYACHGVLKQEGGLRLDSVAFMRTGGDSGPAVVAGDTGASVLLERLGAADAAVRMPPEGLPLTGDQLATIARWIAAGAPAPADDLPEADPRDHWSFRVPQRAPLPQVHAPEWQANPIDRFLAVEHERRGLRPAPPASPEVLLRRLYLDLIGLPPSAADVAEFVRACSITPSLPDSTHQVTELGSNGVMVSESAYLAVVDKLLASPQYGERWGRHWMDVWRYSDWYGRRGENDVRNSYPHIWRWRDWIVRSLNDDKGYDRMIQEMLAADELVPEDDETIAATGYLVRNFFSLHYDTWMRDLVDHTGKAFLGLRMGCALCHDHKYDPISQREYFAMRAFFEPLELRQDRVPGGPPVPKYLRYVPGSGAALRPIEAGLARVYDDRQTEPTYLYRGGDSRDLFEGKPTAEPGVPAILGLPLPKIEPVQLSLAAYYPGAKPWLRREAAEYREREVAQASAAWSAAQAAAEADPTPANHAAERVADLEWQAASARREATQAALAADEAAWSHDDEADAAARRAARLDREIQVALQQITIAKAEETLRLAEVRAAAEPKTKPAVMRAETALAGARKRLGELQASAHRPSLDYVGVAPRYHPQSTGRRTALAVWIASPANPLTARVAVNHVWARHFGKPLAPTVYDLGRGGGEPSHRELLDWLAVEFMEGVSRQALGASESNTTAALAPSAQRLAPNAWSFKHLHRLIVTSRAYRMSDEAGDATEANAAVDQANRYLWRFDRRRMEAEVVRDGLLAVSGLLDATRGGQDIDNKLWATTTRRSLYYTQHPEVGGVMPFLEQFDPPSPTECYRRTESLVPQQALALENSELAQTASTALGRKLWDATAGENQAAKRREALVDGAYWQILNRAPRAEERTACAKFLSRQQSLHEQDADLRAAQSLVRVLFNHHDFITIH
jgi:hypothetical protein